MYQKHLLKKQSILFLIAFGLLLGIMTFIPPKILSPVRSLLNTLTVPFQNLFAWSAYEVRSVTEVLASLRSLKQENERLHQSLQHFAGLQARALLLEEENAALRTIANIEARPDRSTVTGEVIGHDEQGPTTSLRINRGTQQGVQPGMAVVIGNDALIGTITHVDWLTAEVRLLSHPESLVAVRVDGIKSEAIVRGDHGVGLLLDLARSNEPIAPGATVATMSMDSHIPAGLLVGTVDTLRLTNDQLFQQAVVIPPVRADQVRFVTIITKF